MSSLDEVRRAVAAYDAALRAGDLDDVDAWFVRAATTSRFGPSTVAYGAEQIGRERRSRPTPPPVDRIDGRHELFELGDDVVVATLEHHRAGHDVRGRRTQVWWRTPDGWRIAHAHLSVER